MVGGTISDIWSTKEYVFLIMVSPIMFELPYRRGLPMSVFALIALGGTGFGPVYSGRIEMNPKLEWKWIQWIHMMQVIPRGWKMETNFFPLNPG
jgi:hypothetical protein